MASTSMSLGVHWEKFIKSEVESGRYGSATEVVRAALREFEDRSKRLRALQVHLGQGLDQADRREFVEDFSVDDVIDRAKARAQSKA